MKTNIIYETNEKIFGYLPKDKQWIQYKGKLTIKNSGTKPVSLELKFVLPHPPWFNLPMTRTMRAENITEIYARVSKFLRMYGIEFKC